LKNNHNVDLYLTAVRPDMQNKGVNAMLINEMNKIYERIKLVVNQSRIRKPEDPGSV
jgi:hypothetical protein